MVNITMAVSQGENAAAFDDEQPKYRQGRQGGYNLEQSLEICRLGMLPDERLLLLLQELHLEK